MYEDTLTSLKTASKKLEQYTNVNILMGGLFGFVHIYIECKNISISHDIGGVTFLLTYPEPLTRNELYQNKKHDSSC